jgi:hypothetical protein
MTSVVFRVKEKADLVIDLDAETFVTDAVSNISASTSSIVINGSHLGMLDVVELVKAVAANPAVKKLTFSYCSFTDIDALCDVLATTSLGLIRFDYCNLSKAELEKLSLCLFREEPQRLFAYTYWNPRD